MNVPPNPLITGKIVAMIDKPYRTWLIVDNEYNLYYTRDEPLFFQNHTDPDGDEVLPGHTISIVRSLLRRIVLRGSL